MSDKNIMSSNSEEISAKPFIAKTERGKKFAVLRAEIVAANVPLLDRESLAREILERQDERDDQFCHND